MTAARKKASAGGEGRTGKARPAAPKNSGSRKNRKPAKAPSSRVAAKAKATAAQPAAAVTGPARRYLKSKPVCKVTFRLPAEAAPGAGAVAIVGDFNGWDRGTGSMKRLKNGSFSLTLDLETGREYRFRYLIDESRWENDWGADRYEPNAYGSEDSIISI